VVGFEHGDRKPGEVKLVGLSQYSGVEKGASERKITILLSLLLAAFAHLNTPSGSQVAITFSSPEASAQEVSGSHKLSHSGCWFQVPTEHLALSFRLRLAASFPSRLNAPSTFVQLIIHCVSMTFISFCTCRHLTKQIMAYGSGPLSDFPGCSHILDLNTYKDRRSWQISGQRHHGSVARFDLYCPSPLVLLWLPGICRTDPPLRAP
jgi:hypothetical protein